MPQNRQIANARIANRSCCVMFVFRVFFTRCSVLRQLETSIIWSDAAIADADSSSRSTIKLDFHNKSDFHNSCICEITCSALNILILAPSSLITILYSFILVGQSADPFQASSVRDSGNKVSNFQASSQQPPSPASQPFSQPASHPTSQPAGQPWLVLPS